MGDAVSGVTGKIAGLILPSTPNLPDAPKAPDAADAAVRNARLMERRRQLGLSGRLSTFLTTAQGEGPAQPSSTSQPSAKPAPVVNLLGG